MSDKAQHVSFTIESSMLGRIDALIPQLRPAFATPNMFTRSHVIRMLLAEGLSIVEVRVGGVVDAPAEVVPTPKKRVK